MEFIQKYARVDDLDEDDIAEEDEVRRQSDDDFIDDNEIQDQDPSEYRIKNITRDLQEILHYDEVEYDYDDFNGFKKKDRKVQKSLKIFKEGNFSILQFYMGHFLNWMKRGMSLLRIVTDLKVFSGGGALSRSEP